ncbi:MAG: hypothetical protein U0L85_01220 [Bacilli bacterium]|nr:hypothetical protein [Bacilli bacterium]
MEDDYELDKYELDSQNIYVNMSDRTNLKLIDKQENILIQLKIISDNQALNYLEVGKNILIDARKLN